ncbi:MAG TPA: HAMP domain-containing protein, partial [Streptosporangiaceae bacterium]
QATGTASRVAGAERRDELGVLARAFNDMTERLVSANATLGAANEALRQSQVQLQEADRVPTAPGPAMTSWMLCASCRSCSRSALI